MPDWQSVSRRLAGLFRAPAGRAPATESPGQWLEGTYRSTWSESGLIGTERDYRLYLPADVPAGRRLPMVVMLHGCRQDARSFEAGAHMESVARERGFAVLYPEQRRRANPERCWNWFSSVAQSGSAEAALLAGMVEAVTERHGIDPTRVYAAGLSAGGAMTSVLACTHPRLFAAVAVHSGLMCGAATSISGALAAMRNGSDRDPAQAADAARASPDGGAATLPVMVVHGDRDTVVNPKNAEQILAQFARLNGIEWNGTGGGNATLRQGPVPGGYAWTRADWRRGDTVVMRSLLVHGLGHAWSGGDPAAAFNDPAGPSATREIWAFFEPHAR